jgi:hypothetical protein
MDKIKILEAKSNERGLYNYTYLESDYDEDLGEIVDSFSVEHELETNTIKIFELENALKNYDTISKKYRLIAALLCKKASLKDGKEELIRDMEDLKKTSIVLNKRILTYERCLNEWYHLSDGKNEANEYIRRALKIK